MFKRGQTVFIILNNHLVTPATVLKSSGTTYTLRFGNGKGIRLSEHRLYATEEEARARLPVKHDSVGPYKDH